MMRVGSVGAGQVDDLPLGSTAATLANTRILPGGVIRPHRQIPPANPGCLLKPSLLGRLHPYLIHRCLHRQLIVLDGVVLRVERRLMVEHEGAAAVVDSGELHFDDEALDGTAADAQARPLFGQPALARHALACRRRQRAPASGAWQAAAEVSTDRR